MEHGTVPPLSVDDRKMKLMRLIINNASLQRFQKVVAVSVVPSTSLLPSHMSPC